jgi:hypothetical protein
VIDVISDLSDFFKEPMDINLIHKRQNESRAKMDEELKLCTYPSFIPYYEVTDFYYYDLASWEMQEDRQLLINNLIRFTKDFGIKNILDFGAGNGMDTLPLGILPNVHVDAVEIGKHKDFLQFRINKYKANANVSTEVNKNKQYDLVNMITVLEHIYNPMDLILDLAHKTKYFSWVIDLSVESHKMHYSEFFDQMRPLAVGQQEVTLNDIKFTRLDPYANWPVFYKCDII